MTELLIATIFLPSSRGLLAQLDQLTEAQQAIRDHFQEGGSILAVLGVIVLLGGVFWLAAFLSRRQQVADESERLSDPQRIFGMLLLRLNLSAAQRQWLHQVAIVTEAPHPTALLISPQLFDRGVEAWRKVQKDPSKSPKDQSRQVMERLELRKHRAWSRKEAPPTPEQQNELIQKTRARLFSTGITAAEHDST